MSRSRILVWGLSNNRAGTEAVIYNYVRNLPEVDFDFLCYEEPLNYKDLFDSGSRNRYFVIPVKIQHPIAYMHELSKFMHEHGKEYHTLWFNVNDVSNIDLLIYAKRYGIQRRITHMHSSEMPKIFITKFFSKLNWKKCLRLTTDRWACSESAGNFLYTSLPYRVIPNMVDVRSCVYNEDKRNDVRREWSLKDSWVIGTVGRLAEEKNQSFLIRLMPEILEWEPKAKLLLVGDGPLEDDLKKIANELNVEDQIVFAGPQLDVQAYLSSFDVFAFPSLYEGFGISLLEAQYNELPCVISEGVSEEAIVSTNVQTVALSNVEGWVKSLLQCKRETDVLISEKANRYDLKNIAVVTSEMF